MPYEMWDKPSAEVASLKQQCELILEHYEDDIERWFFSSSRVPLQVLPLVRISLLADLDECFNAQGKE